MMHSIADPYRVQCISMKFLLFQLELGGHMPAQAHPWLRHYTCVRMYAMCTYVRTVCMLPASLQWTLYCST